MFAPAWGETQREALGSTAYQDRYEQLGELGEGGMGTVGLFRDRQIGRSVAIKAMRGELSGAGAAEARFVREARIQGQLEHPAIVPVYDIGIDPAGIVYFSMKRVRGVTLEQIIDGLKAGDAEMERRYSRHKLLTVLSSVCLAVDFAHQRGVLHRDIKPANVMLGDFGEVYLLDWGVSRLLDGDEGEEEETVDAPLAESAATLPGTLIGTPGYMAPEQMVGEDAEIGPTSDVYALGAILFEILTLSPLHRINSLRDALSAYAKASDPRLVLRAPEHDVPPELEAICVRATLIDSEARFPTARELAQAIDRFIEGERDGALREQMADQHAAEARTQARLAATSIEARRHAMRAVGRALALNPDHQGAMDALVAMMTTPPQETPPEVALQMERSVAAQRRQTAVIGTVVNLSLLLFLPLLLWIGVRDVLPLVFFYVLAMACAAVSFVASRRRRPGLTASWVVMVLSMVMYACVWPMFGPLVLLPTIMVANTTAFAIQFERRARALVLGIGALVVLVPLLLEMTGVVSASYVFGAEGMIIRSDAVVLDARSLFFIALASVAAMGFAAVVVSRVRDALREAERKLYLYTWHLREFVPEAARVATDPVGRRRSPSLRKLEGSPFSAPLRSDR